jgi:hypothetical protein
LLRVSKTVPKIKKQIIHSKRKFFFEKSKKTENEKIQRFKIQRIAYPRGSSEMPFRTKIYLLAKGKNRTEPPEHRILFLKE